jgi:hypothetical protein
MDLQDTKIFITDWVSENINPEAYSPPRAYVRETAKRCRSEALAAGSSNRGVDAAVRDMVGGGGGLVAFIATAMTEATDDEVRRLAAKDD